MLTEQLRSVRSRGQVKALGRVLDSDADARASAEALAKARGHGAVDDLDGKRLVRLLLDRSSEAQVRTNPIHRDESFTCMNCGREVTSGGARVRDHCPFCLHGRHVDKVPGDRAAECGAILEPKEFSLSGGQVTITYACRGCDHVFRVRAHADDQLPKGLRLSDAK